MDSYKVGKFGGSSLADASQMKKVADIIVAEELSHVVLSNQGKTQEDIVKGTPALKKIGGCEHHQDLPLSVDECVNFVVEKMSLTGQGLGIEYQDLVEKLKEDFGKRFDNPKERVDYVASRGEYYTTLLFARFMEKLEHKVSVATPEEIKLLVSKDFANGKVLQEGYENLKKIKGKEGIVLIPGYYGVTEEGLIVTFSQGGSDLTGGLVAAAIDAEVYQNWTDQDGIYQVDPRLITGASVIPELTYQELAILASRGFNVFHEEAMIDCWRKEIKIHIRNTNNPDADGTIVVSTRIPREDVVGIAALDDLAALTIKQPLADKRTDYIHRISGCFGKYGIPILYSPSERNMIDIIFSQSGVERGTLADLEKDLIKELEIREGDVKIDYHFNKGLLVPTGLGIDQPGVAYKAMKALFHENINVESLEQVHGPLCIQIGVRKDRVKEGLQALYNEFMQK